MNCAGATGGSRTKAEELDKIVQAVLYEGYILYPYRPTSCKNSWERFTFGRVYPEVYGSMRKGAEPSFTQTECLLRLTGLSPSLEVKVRFLQPVWREVGRIGKNSGDAFEVATQLSANGVLYQTWQEAMERDEVLLLDTWDTAKPNRVAACFSFPSSCVVEALPVAEGEAQAVMRRRHEGLEGFAEVDAVAVAPDTFKITVKVSNKTAIPRALCENPDEVLMRTFASTHVILIAANAALVSLLDPSLELKSLAQECKNVGTWPVLVGDEAKAERDTMLSSPIILYDYPKIAPESDGSFFDGTEIDEMLTLRVMTMTDSEKMEMRQVDDFARRILDRTEKAGAEDLLKMHGVMREVNTMEDFFNPSRPLDSVIVQGKKLRVGSSVSIHPKKRADAIDMMLDGKAAMIEAIEQDAEGQVHLALVVEDDPGKDLGLARQTGHRFFYSVEEVEPLEKVWA